MEAKELMQLDWVCLENDPTPRQVDFIRTGEVGLYWNKIVTPPYIKPILITPEILEKNGWGKRPTGYVFYIDEKRYDNSLWYIFDSNTFVVNTAEFQIKYVHELQHALRLCGIETEIVL